jgi:hypothetical protein
VRWLEGRVSTSLRAVNILNENVQQYISGDILKRKVYGEVQLYFQFGDGICTTPNCHRINA